MRLYMETLTTLTSHAPWAFAQIRARLTPHRSLRCFFHPDWFGQGSHYVVELPCRYQ